MQQRNGENYTQFGLLLTSAHYCFWYKPKHWPTFPRDTHALNTRTVSMPVVIGAGVRSSAFPVPAFVTAHRRSIRWTSFS
ncbi:hypothetical protein V6N11_017312 [Hibiscus sabdariffa]|uniref:Uncharacterized protein n=1 Tax=Hibiscus sabdariffa TaxID=183260 RepID=A0ABR2TXQ4_9ROSI